MLNYNQPIKISGPILENDEKYEFVIELRTHIPSEDDS